MTAQRRDARRGCGVAAQHARGTGRRGAQTSRVPVAFLLAAATAVGVAACGDGRDPSGPGGPTPEERVAAIEVISPIDTVMAAGRSVRLEAAAREADGTAVTGVTFTWTSSNQAVAAVDETGLVQAAAPGTSAISAAAGDATGRLRMHVVDVDLAAIPVVEVHGNATRRHAVRSSCRT